LARPLSRLFFGRLDARTASYGATRELMQQFFPADYRVILPGTDVLERRDHTPVEILLIADEERAALRLFLRALRGIPLELDWHAPVWSRRPLAGSATLSRALRARIEFIDAEQISEAEAL